MRDDQNAIPARRVDGFASRGTAGANLVQQSASSARRRPHGDGVVSGSRQVPRAHKPTETLRLDSAKVYFAIVIMYD